MMTKKGNYPGQHIDLKGTSVIVRDDFSKSLRTFTKKVQETGILKEVRDRMSYEPPSVRKQRMKKQARKRWEKQVEGLISEGKWLKGKKY